MGNRTPVVVRMKVGDGEYEIDLSNLTLQEQVEIEEHFEKPLPEVQREGWLFSSTKGLVFLAYLARRRREPGFTYGQALTLGEGNLQSLDVNLGPRPGEEPEAEPDRPTGPPPTPGEPSTQD